MKFLLFIILLVFGIKNGQCDLVATANIHVDSSAFGIGTLLFHQQDENSPVRIVGIIDSLKSNTVHGFHVHENELPHNEYNCSAAGPHFNPFNTGHGPREADIKNRHVGDLGNVTANENGIIIVEITDAIIDLYAAERSIANRTIVLHAMRDDGGKGGFPDSNTTGNAGARIACGRITIDTQVSGGPVRPWKVPTIKEFIRKVFP